MAEMEMAVLVLALGLMLLGLIGTIVPLVPGIPLILLGIIGYGAFTGFARYSWNLMGLAVALALVGIAGDYLGGLWAAKRCGASRQGLVGAALGLVFGTVVLGLPGALLLPLLGAVAGEVFSGKDLREALRVGLGALVGLLGAGLVKFIVGLLLILIFLFQVLWAR